MSCLTSNFERLTMTVLSDAILWRKLRGDRIAAQKLVDLQKEKEDILRGKILASLEKNVSKSVSNGDRLFQLVTKDEPAPDDWPKIQEYIKKTGEFDIMQARLSPVALKLRRDAGVKVPGVAWYPVNSLSDTKAKS